MATEMLNDARLLSFARALQSAQTHDELLDAVVTEVRESVGPRKSGRVQLRF